MDANQRFMCIHVKIMRFYVLGVLAIQLGNFDKIQKSNARSLNANHRKPKKYQTEILNLKSEFHVVGMWRIMCLMRKSCVLKQC